MKILMVGDLVGSPGRHAFAQVVTKMRQAGAVDFVAVNAENAAGGRGLTGPVAEELFGAGADVITLGDHTWDQRELRSYLDREPRVIRPLNFAPGCPGRGWVSVDIGSGETLTLVCAIGRVFMNNYDCPYRAMDALLRDRNGLGKIILLDFHAEATSEKIIMGRYLDGRVSAVVGTHTHVQTSDEQVLAKGTAYLTDLGMTGAKDSALGRDLPSVTAMLLTGMPAPFKVAGNDVVLEGALIEVDRGTGRARKIRRIREAVP